MRFPAALVEEYWLIEPDLSVNQVLHFVYRTLLLDIAGHSKFCEEYESAELFRDIGFRFSVSSSWKKSWTFCTYRSKSQETFLFIFCKYIWKKTFFIIGKKSWKKKRLLANQIRSRNYFCLLIKGKKNQIKIEKANKNKTK